MAVDLVDMEDLKHILKDTITAICRSRLHQAVQLSIEALIGVTINKSQMLLVNINEDLKPDASAPLTGFQQGRSPMNTPPRKFAKTPRGRGASAHSFSSIRAANRGRPKGLKNILPRLPVSATQSSTSPTTSVTNIKEEEKDSPLEKKARSILLTAGDTFSPDTGELLPNPSNIIPLEPRFDAQQGEQLTEKDESEENSRTQTNDMLPGIEGSHTDGSRQVDDSMHDSLMSSVSQQSSKVSQEDEDAIGTLSMVCDTDDPSEDSFKIKQEAPDYDDNYDAEGQDASSPIPGSAMFPSPKILDILNQPPKTFPKECRKRKILTLERRIQVLEMLQSGRSARSIAAQLGVGRTQIQNILKEKELILSKWVQGANSDMKYINPRRRPYADVDNLVWQWFQEYSSCGVHITGKLIQHTALELAKALGNEKFSASNGWLESWQRRHNVKLSALYEAHKSKPNTSQAESNVEPESEEQEGAKVEAAGEEQQVEPEPYFKSAKVETTAEEPQVESEPFFKSTKVEKTDEESHVESESFFKSGQDVIMEPNASEERSDVLKTTTTYSSSASSINAAGLVKGIALQATKAALKSFENAKPRKFAQGPYGNGSNFEFNPFRTDASSAGTSSNDNINVHYRDVQDSNAAPNVQVAEDRVNL